ncbi:DUF1801 domain-containing protein [Sphingorhabdus sp. 109]|uniref:DUF1801 domain-containing protein n=1 Tax=Sphingorhabdus sp. 109 TaxID=2653173 RepID=UPI0012F25979|nr:DUF1801 domain-containing protein [Sphingorhabdus sp. 109]VWX57759.1 conserved hypothetical protein [Sphingorhabdus sp. 109]
MAKADLKTQPNDADVDAFIATAQPDRRQEEARQLVDLFRHVTGEDPLMWGSTIIGFGSYDYKYASGREGSMCRTGFSPRKTKISIYLMGAYCTPEAQTEQERLFGLLGKHSVGKSCLYINRLEQVDIGILEQLIRNNWDLMNDRYPQ